MRMSTSGNTFNTSGTLSLTVASLLGGLILSAGCGGDGTTGTSGQALTFTGEASGSQAAPPTSSDASASVELSLSADQSTLTYKVTHTVTAASAVEIRSGRPGERGDVVFQLDSAASATGSVQVSAVQVADLKAGRFYLNIQSASFNLQGRLSAEGEVRAQIFDTRGVSAGAAASETTQFYAQLSGLQKFPPVSVAGAGAAQLTLNEQTGELTYNIQHTLAGAAAASLGQGAFSVNGDLFAKLVSGAPLAATVTGKTTLTVEQQRKLKSGLLFLELEGAAAAALRGQVLINKALPFNVALGAAPLVSTTARGTVSFFLSDDMKRLNYRLNHTAQEVTGAVIVKGDAALGGQVVCTLGSGKDRDQGSCEVKASGGLSDLLVSDLSSGVLHVDVITKAQARGELRGVILLPPRL